MYSDIFAQFLSFPFEREKVTDRIGQFRKVVRTSRSTESFLSLAAICSKMIVLRTRHTDVQVLALPRVDW
jgi:hypothetical protein